MLIVLGEGEITLSPQSRHESTGKRRRWLTHIERSLTMRRIDLLLARQGFAAAESSVITDSSAP